MQKQEHIAQDEEMEDDEVGSPSPPYEGVIIEEPEKQLESRGGDNNGNQTTDDIDQNDDEVRIDLEILTCHHVSH